DLVVQARIAQVAEIAAHDLAAPAIIGVFADFPASTRQADRADRVVHAQVAQVRNFVAEAHRLAAIIGVAIDSDRGLVPAAALTGAIVIPAAAGTVRPIGTAGAVVFIVAAMVVADQQAVIVADIAAGAPRQLDRGLAHIAVAVATVRVQPALIHIGAGAALRIGAARRATGLTLRFSRPDGDDGEAARRHDQTCRCNHELLHDTVSLEVLFRRTTRPGPECSPSQMNLCCMTTTDDVFICREIPYMWAIAPGRKGRAPSIQTPVFRAATAGIHAHDRHPDAQGHRGLAGGQHLALARAPRRLLRPAPACASP